MRTHKQGYRRVICLALCIAMLLSLSVAAFAEEPADRRLILDYDFESIENNIVQDQSGNHYDGTLNGNAASLAGGVTGNGLSLNGDYVRIPAKAIQGLTDVTISAQVYIKSLTPHSGSWYDKPSILKPTTLLFAGQANTSKAHAMLNTQSFDFGDYHEGCGWTICTPSFSQVRIAASVDQHPAEGKWSDLAMVQEGTTVRIYLDGQLVREQTGVTAHLGDVYVDENTPVYIGRSDWGDFAPDAVIDNFRIYNYAMTADELPRTDLVLDYEFETLEEGKIRDLSGNGFDGEVAGTATLVNAVTGMGLNLEGAGDFVRVPAAVLKNLTDVSIVGQVKLSSLADVTGLFAGGAKYGTYMSVNAKGVNAPQAGWEEGFTYAIKGKSGKEHRPSASLNEVVPAGEWCTFACVQKGSTVTLYLNGKQVATGDVGGDTLSDVYVSDDTELYLGKPLAAWNDPKSYGIFDSFRIYSRALDASEIPGQPIDPNPPYVPTAFEEQVDYIHRAVNYLMNDGEALPQPKLDDVSVTWTLLEGDAEIRDGKLYKTEASQERQPVRLKAEISMEGEQTQTLTFDHVTLMDAWAGYILSFFGVNGWTNDDGDAENFRIAYSYDGLHWAVLNNNEPIVKPEKTVNDKGDAADSDALKKRVRDPFIMRNKDGSFTLMASQSWSHPNIFLWYSNDLTTIENERLSKVVTKSNTAGATGYAAWAPEGTYDPITDQYYIYWSDPQGNGGVGCTYYNTSADLETFSDAGVLFDPHGRHIDANIIKYDGVYYMDYRSNLGKYNEKGLDGIRLAKATRLGDRTFTSYTGDVNPYRTDSAAEGSFIFKVNGENRWYLYWDYNDIHQFAMMETTDLDSGEWTDLGVNQNMPSENVRHGGSTPVTQKELDAILAKWNPDGEKLKISEVAALAQTELTVTENKQLSELELPTSVIVTLSNGMKATADVAWESSDYQPGVNGSYTLTGNLSLSEAEKAKIPSASSGTVTVDSNGKTVSMTCVVELTMADKTALEGAISRAEAITDSNSYCTPTWNAMLAALTTAKDIAASESSTQTQVDTAVSALNAAIAALIEHSFSEGYQSDKDGHWHACQTNGCTAVTSKENHTPDRNAPTETESVKCVDCGYTMQAATGHQHHLTLKDAEDATCISEGHKAYYTCSGCSDWFEDAEGIIKIEDKASVVIGKDSAKHVGGTEIRGAKDATYTEEGYSGDTYCKSCNAKIAEGHVIPKLTKPSNPSGGTVRPVSPNAGVNKKPEAEKKELPFTDVPQTAWYHESVQKAWENGLIDGITKTQFQPDGTLTVAQAIKLAAALYQMEREGEVTLTNGSVNWYDSYVSYAIANGIIEKDYASFTAAQMNAAITRAEFVHIFHGAESTYKAINQVANDAIPDVKTGDAFASDIYEFYRAGILTGSDAKGTFHPASSIKRSEVSTILVRMFDTASRQSITL